MSDIARPAPAAHADDLIGPEGTRRPSNRHDLILRAAIDLFHRHGYHATGVDDIGQAVDVSGPAIYRHFASKEDILVEAVALAADRVHAANESARAQRSDPAALMESYVRAFAQVAIDEASLIRVWVSEARHLTPERRSPMTRRIKAWTDEWVDALIRWRPDISLADARLLVAGAIGVINTVATVKTSAGKNLEDRVTDMALATLNTPIRESR